MICHAGIGEEDKDVMRKYEESDALAMTMVKEDPDPLLRDDGQDPAEIHQLRARYTNDKQVMVVCWGR